MEDGKIFCPECEIKALRAEVTREKIEETVSKMAYTEGITAPQELYNERMAVCRACPELLGEIQCAQCASYAAFRAKQLSGRCPLSRW